MSGVVIILKANLKTIVTFFPQNFHVNQFLYSREIIMFFCNLEVLL